MIWSDGELASSELCSSNALLLRDAGPWGQGFAEPLFDGEFQLLEQRLVGGNHLKLQLADGSGQQFDGIAFNVDLQLWPNPALKRIHIAYQLDLNSFRGVTSLQLRISRLWPAGQVPGLHR